MTRKGFEAFPDHSFLPASYDAIRVLAGFLARSLLFSEFDFTAFPSGI